MARLALVLLLALPTVAALPAQEKAAKAPAKDPFAAVRAARAGGYRMLLRQFRADEPQLGERHEAGARNAMPEYQGQRDLPAANWVWVRPHWFLFRDGPRQAMAAASWGPEQACGAPDTPEAGDHGTAWASREEDAAGEWLLLEFWAPVRATKLEVHETFNPGALERVTIFNPDGDELEVWKAAAVGAAKEQKRALVLDLPLGFTVERVKLYLKSEAVAGWNEIDAVGLHDDKGKVHWAACAEASTTFANAEQRARVVRAVVAARQPAERVEVADLLQRVAREQRVQLELDTALRRSLETARNRALAQLAEKPAGAAEPAAGEAALQARTAALEARIALMEAELARLRAELAKVKADAKK